MWGHGRVEVELVDLPCFGRRTRLIWSKQRRRCPNPTCRVVTFVESDDRIAADRAGMTAAPCRKWQPIWAAIGTR